MAFLDRFEYDIFLSHGWAGNPNGNVGHRKWVADLVDRLRVGLSDRLSERFSAGPVSICLDVNTPRNGDTDVRFQQWMRESATLLAVVTPSFCREKSYCRKELRWFSEFARPIHGRNMSATERTFKVISAPYRPEDEPSQLDGISPYTLHEGKDPGKYFQDYFRQPIASLDSNSDTRLFREYTMLEQALANFLSVCKQNQSSFPIRRIFLAESTLTNRQSMAEQLRTSEVVSCALKADTSEAEFLAQTRTELAVCDRSIHLFDPAASLVKEPHRPPGWKRSVFENQLMCAFEQPEKKSGFRQIVWCDRTAAIPDDALRLLAERVESEFTASGFVDFVPQGYQYLTSNLPGILARTQGVVLPRTVIEELADSPVTNLYVQCKEHDLSVLEPVFRRFYGSKVWVQFPLFGGKPSDLEKIHLQFLEESDGTFIYFGKAAGTWAYLRCEEAMHFYGDAADTKTRLVGLDPPFDPVRQSFRHRHFKTVPFPASSGTFDPAKLLAGEI